LRRESVKHPQGAGLIDRKGIDFSFTVFFISRNILGFSAC